MSNWNAATAKNTAPFGWRVPLTLLVVLATALNGLRHRHASAILGFSIATRREEMQTTLSIGAALQAIPPKKLLA